MARYFVTWQWDVLEKVHLIQRLVNQIVLDSESGLEQTPGKHRCELSELGLLRELPIAKLVVQELVEEEREFVVQARVQDFIELVGIG